MKLTLTILTLLALSSFAEASSIKSCLGCHGKTFEKKAMGKSKIVRDMSQQDIKVALDGYKDRSYGGVMQNLMFSQVKGISDTEEFSQKVFDIGHEDNSNKMFTEKESYISLLKTALLCSKNAKNKADLEKCKIK